MARKSSIDGFIPRRSVGRPSTPANSANERNNGLTRSTFGGTVRPIDKLPTGIGRRQDDQVARPISLERPEATRSNFERSDLEQSLAEIDQDDQGRTGRRGGRRRRRDRRPRKLWRRIVRWLIVAIIVAVVATGGWLAYKVLSTSGSVFKGNFLGLVQQQPLKMDANGRSNILVLGTSEDDPGHEGAYLTDSIMVISIDQKNHNAYLVSIPRDLPVKYGMACNSGYSGKINEYFNCVNGDYSSPSAEDERQAETRQFIGDILGLDIQYSVHINYSVMRDLVGALGTITVDIEGSDGAPGVMDSNFDWKCRGGNAYASLAVMKQNCPPNGHFIDYPNGPAVLDAEHALYLAQARGDSIPTYGLGHSNFDREQNQQKIILAIRDKAMSTGTLTNLSKVTGILDAIGDNLRTNFDTSEVRTLVDLAQKIPDSSIVRLNLLDDGIMTGNAVPTAGMFNFTELRSYIKSKLSSDPVHQEEAKVVVLNASGVAGLASSQANKLADLGMNVIDYANAPESAKEGVNVVYQLSSDAPATAKKLTTVYGVQPTVATSVPGVEVADGTQFVVIVGKDPSTTKTP